MKKIFIAVISTLLSLILIVCLLNYYLKFSHKGQKGGFLHFIAESANFSPSMVFDAKSWCEQYPKNCNIKEENFLPFPVEIFPSSSDQNSGCRKILFLGDSFVEAPWTNDGESFASQFSKLWSNQSTECIRVYRLAKGGWNNQQELKALSDRVRELKPNIVIWQFYWNDEYENPQYEIFDFSTGMVKPRYAWYNTTFLTGFLNQYIPFLPKSTLGETLYRFGEYADIFRYWPIDINDENQVKAYNHKTIPALFTEMQHLSQTYNFRWYTTLGPLECEFVKDQSPEDCQGYVYENDLRLILKKNSSFLSMEEASPSSSIEATVSGVIKTKENQQLFNTTEDHNLIGGRHLSPRGNNYFGEILYHNFQKMPEFNLLQGI